MRHYMWPHNADNIIDGFRTMPDHKTNHELVYLQLGESLLLINFMLTKCALFTILLIIRY